MSITVAIIKIFFEQGVRKQARSVGIQYLCSLRDKER